MKYITEEDLRALYKIASFTIYEEQEGTRLTPGARQFLNDKKITLGERRKLKEECHLQRPEFLLIQAEVLQTGIEFLETETWIAKELFDLERYLAEVSKGNFLHGETAFEGCTGMSEEIMGTWMEDCFEITGFHAQSPKGKQIIKLHYLRCSLRKLESELSREENKAVHKIMNRLSQIICLLFGGEVCQRTQHVSHAIR